MSVFTPGSGRLTLTRLEDRLAPAAGDLDPAFGSGGTAVVGLDPVRTYPLASTITDEFTDLAAQSDGRLVTSATISTVLQVMQGGTPIRVAYEKVVARFLPDGTPDPTFGAGGRVTLSSPADPDGWSGPAERGGIAVRPDGAVVVILQSRTGGVVYRLTPAGVPDPTFGAGGRVLLPAAGDFELRVAVAADGAVLVSAVDQGGVAVTRLTPAGEVDPAYGFGGTARLEAEPPGAGSTVDVLLLSDGQALVA